MNLIKSKKAALFRTALKLWVEGHAIVVGIFVRFRPVGEAKAENDGDGSSAFKQD